MSEIVKNYLTSSYSCILLLPLLNLYWLANGSYHTLCPSGTFLAWDKVSVLFQFVRDSLVDGWQPFELVAPGGHKLQEDQEVALNECSLVSRDIFSEM